MVCQFYLMTNLVLGSKSYFSFTDEFINQETKNRECCLMDTNKIKKGLGRGLSSLIGETKDRSTNINKLSISDLGKLTNTNLGNCLMRKD